MFILYAIPIGIVAGYLAGGRLERLGALRLRWAPLALLGLAIQVLIFSDPVGGLVGDAGPRRLRRVDRDRADRRAAQRRDPRRRADRDGAGCNLAAIVANGGWMPADADALASVGGLPAGASNSIVVADPALGPLTDLFALPAALPLANVFSVGDVLIGAGVAVTIALAMRAAPAAPAAGEAGR